MWVLVEELSRSSPRDIDSNAVLTAWKRLSAAYSSGAASMARSESKLNAGDNKTCNNDWPLPCPNSGWSHLRVAFADEHDHLMVRVLHTVAHVCAASSGVGSEAKKAGKGGAELSAAECATTVSFADFFC